MRYSHEDSIIQCFINNFVETARNNHQMQISAPLDGQDRNANADYLFTSHDKYAIIEFKYLERNLASEKNKEKSLALCKALETNHKMNKLHSMCHFIAHGFIEDSKKIELNIYYNEICNEKVWGNKFNSIKKPNREKTKNEDKFIDTFLSGHEGASFQVFNHYMMWLLNESDGRNKNGYLELLIANPIDHRAKRESFKSVSEMNDWIIKNVPDSFFKPTSATNDDGGYSIS